MLGFSAIGVLPLAGLAVGGAAVPAYTALLNAPQASRCFLAELDAWDGAAAQTLYLADRPFVSGATDDPANTLYDSRLVQAINFGRSVAIEPEGTPRGEVNAGEIVFAIGDGRLDDQLGWSFDGRSVAVYIGAQDWPRAHFLRIFAGRGAGLSHSMVRATIDIVGTEQDLDRPLQTAVYAGTGGLEGTADLTGREKPLIRGAPFNLEPVPINPAALIYQVNDGAIADVVAVRDSGNALTQDADYPTYEALLAAAVPVEAYATCKALGLIMLGRQPVGSVRADVQAVGYASETAASLIQWIVETGGGSVNAMSFDRLRRRLPGPVDLHVSDGRHIPDVLDEVCSGLGAVWWTDRSGEVNVAPIRVPGSTPALSLSAVEVLSFERAGSVLPVTRMSVGYRRNWAPLDQFAEIVSETDRLLYREPSTLATAENAGVAAAHPNAVPAVRAIASLRELADAQEVADRLATVFSVRRDLYQARIKALGWTLSLLDVIEISNLRGVDRSFVIVGLEEQAAAQVIDLTLFG